MGEVREGFGGKVICTVIRNEIRQGYGGPVIGTIDGHQIRRGFGGEVVATISGNQQRAGFGGMVLATIEGNQIRDGYGGQVLGTASDGGLIYLTPKALEITKRAMEKNPTGAIFRNADGRQWTPARRIAASAVRKKNGG